MTIAEDFSLLELHDFELLPYAIVDEEDYAVEEAAKIGYPIVLKIISPEILHKTDMGCVKVGIKDEEGLRHAYKDIMQNADGKKVDGMLVQKMGRKGVEVIVGGKKDDQFGHMVVIGLGGIYVEIFRDISARICPLEASDVDEMIAELKVHPLLEGARGEKPINKKALTDLVLKVCRFMKKVDLKEMDLNPVVFDDKGCDIVDARFSR
jgi:acetyl-CoA synthetase (ADP-forming)